MMILTPHSSWQLSTGCTTALHHVLRYLFARVILYGMTYTGLQGVDLQRLCSLSRCTTVWHLDLQELVFATASVPLCTCPAPAGMHSRLSPAHPHLTHAPSASEPQEPQPHTCREWYTSLQLLLRQAPHTSCVPPLHRDLKDFLRTAGGQVIYATIKEAGFGYSRLAARQFLGTSPSHSIYISTHCS